MRYGKCKTCKRDDYLDAGKCPVCAIPQRRFLAIAERVIFCDDLARNVKFENSGTAAKG